MSNPGNGRGGIWMPPAPTGDTVPPLLATDGPEPKFEKTIEQIRTSCAQLRARAPEREAHAESLDHDHTTLTCLPHHGSDFHHKEPPLSTTALMHLPLADQAVFQRLNLVFDLVVCRAFRLLSALNCALELDDVEAYRNARNAYIKFTGNLENRHPSHADIDPKEGLGYGGHIVWASIEPWIRPNDFKLNVIVGARIQVKWNPHYSSSGIPVQHA